MPKFFKRWQASKSIDLRSEVTNIFEEVVGVYLFGDDVVEKEVTMQVIKKDGTVVKENQKIFRALDTCLHSAGECYLARRIFGDNPMTKGLQISFSNWDQLCKMIDEIVIKRKIIFDEQ